MQFRVGQGFDAHALVPGRRLVLAGVEVPAARGLLGHSDADVVAHALIDALLGASALGDIGKMFPDSDERYHDADSMQLLRVAVARVLEEGWTIANVDCTVVAQQPKIAPHVESMRTALADALGIDASAVSIKGKTTEWLGFTGRGEGIASLVVAALTRA
jgi:2-C-methyl-D-erythritol 2,4-cyclodiphosphate synthase